MVPASVDLNGDNFVLANLEMSGFYRVNYDQSNWDKIMNQLRNKKEVKLNCNLRIILIKKKSFRQYQ